MSSQILVCGSLNVDVIAQSDELPSTIYKKGSVSFNFGGGGHNMAINMKELGISSAFLGVVNDGAMANLALGHLESHGVKTFVQTMENMDDAIFVSFFFKGVLQSATTSSAAESAILNQDVIDKAVNNAESILTTAVFSEEVLQKLEKTCMEKRKPFFVNVTTESHASKIACLHHVTCAFMNMREAKKLQEHMGHKTLESMVDQLDFPLIVLQGKSAVMHLEPGKGATVHKVEAVPVKGSTLGVGDLVVCNLIGSWLRDGMYNFEECRFRAEEILSVPYGHLGSSSPLKISIQKETQKADADTLTGTLNRRGINKFIERRTRTRGKLTALLIDIDHFKNVNDTYGHDIGDNVICEVSCMLKKFIRASDALSRWGGEEFLLLLPGIGGSAAYNLAERMRKHVASHKITGMDKNVTVSIGIAERQADENFMALVKHADIALYEAKRNGRNKAVAYTKELEEKSA